MSCSKSSLEAAAEAAARVNAMLIAKGKLKLPPNNNKVNKTGVNIVTGLKTTGDLFTAEVEINDAPLSARNMLTRGVTQDEINKYSGAAVSTRGRYMTFEDRAKNANERPLYLHIQASTKEAVDLAVEKIHKIIEQHLKSTGSTIKWSRTATTVRSGPNSSSPPPLMSINTDTLSSGQSYVQDKIFVGLENTPVAFQLKEKIVGPGESYLQHIRTETGASVFLKGKGSGFLEPASGREAFEPLHIHLTHPKQKGLLAAKELAINLIQTVQQEYAQWQQQQTLTVLTIQSQQSALGAQQVALQQSLQTQMGIMTAGTLGIGVAPETVAALGVAQNHLQASSLQVGGLNGATVATSIPAFLPTSLSSSLTTSLPSILTTNSGGQLHLVQGQMLSQAGGMPTLVGHTQPLQTTTANMNILPQPSQMVYTPAFQQQVQTSQAMVQATQAILTSQAQMAAATQQQHQFSQVALQSHAQAAVAQQQAGVAPTTFFFVSQAPLPSTGFSIANNPSATVQLHVDAQAQAQVQALAQAQVQAAAQAQQQSQNQARVLQQVTNVPPAGTSLVAAYPFQFPQVTNVVASTHTTPTAVTYPHYRTQGEVLAGQKRKFQEDAQLRESYLYGAQSMRSPSQPGMMSMSPATSANYNHHHHHHAMVSTVAAPGLQANPSAAPGIALPPHLMPSSLAAPKPNELTYRDQQLMPPPPVPVSQGGGNMNSRNAELDRKRLKGALWKVASVYGSSDEEDDDPGSSMSPVNRHLQRSTSRRNFPPYGAKPNMYPMPRNEEQIIPQQPPSLQGQVSYSQNSQLRYQYQSPFWMAPN